MSGLCLSTSCSQCEQCVDCDIRHSLEALIWPTAWCGRFHSFFLEHWLVLQRLCFQTPTGRPSLGRYNAQIPEHRLKAGSAVCLSCLLSVFHTTSYWIMLTHWKTVLRLTTHGEYTGSLATWSIEDSYTNIEPSPAFYPFPHLFQEPATMYTQASEASSNRYLLAASHASFYASKISSSCQGQRLSWVRQDFPSRL